MPFFHLAPLCGEVFDLIAEECCARSQAEVLDVRLLREALSGVWRWGNGATVWNVCELLVVSMCPTAGCMNTTWLCVWCAGQEIVGLCAQEEL